MELIRKYFPNLNSLQLQQLGQLGELYKDWNTKINVISRKDINELYERHILHSLGIAKYIDFVPGTSVMDVGTGGGFPGIPLAILFPDTNFYLVDSIAKKIKVAEGVSQSLGLKNVNASQNRAEKVNGQFDFVVSRAVTAFPKFVSLVRKKISSKQQNKLANGILYLKGGDFQDELKSFKNQVHVYSLSQYFQEDFFETKKLIHLSLKKVRK